MVAEGSILWKSFKSENGKSDGPDLCFWMGIRHAQGSCQT